MRKIDKIYIKINELKQEYNSKSTIEAINTLKDIQTQIKMKLINK